MKIVTHVRIIRIKLDSLKILRYFEIVTTEPGNRLRCLWCCLGSPTDVRPIYAVPPNNLVKKSFAMFQTKIRLFPVQFFELVEKLDVAVFKNVCNKPSRSPSIGSVFLRVQPSSTRIRTLKAYCLELIHKVFNQISFKDSTLSMIKSFHQFFRF